ncbi:Acyl dehydratase [Streptomyces sp. DpondAA-D4]|nr:Acyl dehydratase [Streptomyces sp. DpondAA-D4]
MSGHDERPRPGYDERPRPGYDERPRPGYEERLQGFTGRELRPLTWAQDPVNQPMIRHWTEAMGDTNPVYTDAAAARATGRTGVVAPASMVQAWTMRGYAATVAPPSPSAPGGFDALVALLDEGGYTSVVATDSAFTFLRELETGDHVAVRETVESVSAEKRTALGTGRFVTTLKTYTDRHGATVATQRWRTLRFRPAPAAPPDAAPAPAPVPPSTGTTPSSSRGPSDAACSSSAAPAARPFAIPPAPAAPGATPWSGTPSKPPARGGCTASW